MPSPRFEVPAGAVDGVNTVFTVSMPYSVGSTAVFRNGLLQQRDLDDGWFETDPNAGIVTMKEPPSAFGFPDIIQIFFLDRTPSPAPAPGTVAFNLKGIIKASKKMTATLASSLQITGYISSAKPLLGQLELRKDLRGSIQAHPTLKATIRECT